MHGPFGRGRDLFGWDVLAAKSLPGPKSKFFQFAINHHISLLTTRHHGSRPQPRPLPLGHPERLWRSVLDGVCFFLFPDPERETRCVRQLFLPLSRLTPLSTKNSAIGGTIWHGIKGFRNSPYGERRIGALTAIKMRAPVLGGNFGVWGGLFSTFDCAVKGIRKKEDPWNAITAGFFTGGALAIRGGYKAARNGAIGCAVLLAVIEGVGIGFQKMMAGATKLEVSRPSLFFFSFRPELHTLAEH